MSVGQEKRELHWVNKRNAAFWLNIRCIQMTINKDALRNKMTLDVNKSELSDFMLKAR